MACLGSLVTCAHAFPPGTIPSQCSAYERRFAIAPQAAEQRIVAMMRLNARCPCLQREVYGSRCFATSNDHDDMTGNPDDVGKENHTGVV